jgi:flagellar biosynthesis protein FlhA
MAQTATVTGASLLFRGLGTPLLLVIMLAMMVVPLPPFLLDILFTFSITLSLVVLLAAVYARRPLDFAAFPTVLLLATLLRLALNVASTRVVLLHGHTGTDAAGQVIKAFGEFVVGGNYTVGLVVFVVLVIINFVVVTKGAGRISEVSARFTLDAMPGKQMAIDADLNAGLIDQNEARRRRQEVTMEADFYGAMDGASKFVRGDAIAGILIVFINILGGLAIGALQHGLPVAEAARNFTLLTIGDGLVTQIPSLLLSTAAAIMVTRVSTTSDMGTQILSQLFASPRALGITAGVIGALGLVPGMPNVAFLLLAGVAGFGAYYLSQRPPVAEPAGETSANALTPAAAGPPAAGGEPKELSWDDVASVDAIGLEVGYRLISLVDKAQGGPLMARIKGVRKKLSQEIGFLVPAVHIRDNLTLAPNAYRILLQGAVVGEGTIYPERDMAINPGKVYGTIGGIDTKEPAFGMPAVWIEPGAREQAQTLGYTVVDSATVIATHLSQIVQTHAHELLSYEDTKQLLDKLGKTAPRLIEDLTPKLLPLSAIHKVLQNLLSESIPVRDIRTIAETLAEQAARSQDTGALTAAVRIALGRSIIQHINGLGGELPVITLDPGLEQLLLQAMQADSAEAAAIEPGLAEKLRNMLIDSARRQEAAGQPAVLVVSPALRPWFARFARAGAPYLHVLAYTEIPADRPIRVVASIGK